MLMPKKCTNPEHIERYVNGRCVECQRLGRRKHYYNNKDQYYGRNKKVKDDMFSYVRTLKESSGCVDCGMKYPFFVLDFHHLVPEDKSDNVGTIISRGNWKALYDEIAKCVVLCANCHRFRTWA